jgi:eukaryotic-like serine/threonine-protein kinase
MSDPDYTIPISATENSYPASKTKYGYKVLSAGDVIGKKYQIIKELGSGGFATTYLAKVNDRTQRKCVIKQLQPRFNSPAIWENARERLDTEGMVLQWLGKHAQIPELIDHFAEHGQFYLILEFIEGEEFDREVQKELLNEAQMVRFLYDVLNVLDFVHQQGVIHRDIKPTNLIRRVQDGRIILIDFGAVKEIGTAIFESPQETMQTQVIGTPGYMPPEQNSGKPLYSSDIYALGKTAIYGLTGRSPTDWEEIETNEMISWCDRTSVSPEFTKIIQKMTAPKTADRYQSAEEVLEELAPLLKVGTTISDNYLILNYLGGERQINNYLVKHLKQPGSPLFYLKILRPKITQENNLQKIKQDLNLEINKFKQVYEKQQVLKILDCFIEQDSICLLQEYLEGYNFLQLIERKAKIAEEDVIELLISVSIALNDCHKNQIIHGNIKPISILKRRNNGKMILQNFGSINRFANGCFGTDLGYIPPEQIAGRITYASDIYALGMTAIHCLTGTIPQKLNISNQTGEILWEQNAQVKPGLTKIINKMVCLERKKRYSSANQVLKAVKKLKRKNQIKAWYFYLLGLPILLGIFAFISAKWSQRAAILEFYNGNIRLERQQYLKAIEYYDEGLKKVSKTRRQVQNFEQVWLKKAIAYNHLQQYEKALATCQEALRYYQSYQLWNCQGLAYDNLEQYQEAIAAYNKAIALNPDYVWSWNNRGDAYSKLGENTQAISDFQKAIDLDPAKSFVSWNNLGKLYYQQQNYQQAIKAYEEALKVQPEYLPALIGLGNAQKSSQLYNRASDSYDRALAISPNYYEAWYGKGSVSEYLEDYTSAREYYQQASRLKPDWQAASDALKRVNEQINNLRNR